MSHFLSVYDESDLSPPDGTCYMHLQLLQLARVSEVPTNTDSVINSTLSERICHYWAILKFPLSTLENIDHRKKDYIFTNSRQCRHRFFYKQRYITFLVVYIFTQYGFLCKTTSFKCRELNYCNNVQYNFD